MLARRSTELRMTGHGTGLGYFRADVTEDELRKSTREVDFGQGTVGGVLQGVARHDIHRVRRASARLAAGGTNDIEAERLLTTT